MRSFVFRDAASADAQALAALHIESWRLSYRGILPDDYLDGPIVKERMDLWQARMSLPIPKSRYVHVVQAEDKTVGFVCVLLDAQPELGACLDNLHVLPAFKGRGLGRKLFASAAAWVRSKQPDRRLHLWVFEANHEARRFYDKYGGKIVRRVHKGVVEGIAVPSLLYVWSDLDTLLRKLTENSR